MKKLILGTFLGVLVISIAATFLWKPRAPVQKPVDLSTASPDLLPMPKAIPKQTASVPTLEPTQIPQESAALDTVQWTTSFPEALEEAKRTGKPIFVDVFTTWCGPCKFLDAVTYKDPSFVAESKKWILVKLDAEKNTQNVKFASRFKVEGYPTMIFMTPDGKESGRAVGGYPAKMLVPVMKKAGVKAGGGRSI